MSVGELVGAFEFASLVISFVGADVGESVGAIECVSPEIDFFGTTVGALVFTSTVVSFNGVSVGEFVGAVEFASLLVSFVGAAVGETVGDFECASPVIGFFGAEVGASVLTSAVVSFVGASVGELVGALEFVSLNLIVSFIVAPIFSSYSMVVIYCVVVNYHLETNVSNERSLNIFINHWYVAVERIGSSSVEVATVSSSSPMVDIKYFNTRPVPVLCSGLSSGPMILEKLQVSERFFQLDYFEVVVQYQHYWPT